MRADVIAIDGPVAVGKSTVGYLLAKRLNYSFIDTGAMYRALTWKALKLGINLDDEAKLSQLAATTKISFNFSAVEGQHYSVFVDGEDVTTELREPEVERGVSLVSKIAPVRHIMVEEQRKLARGGKVVMAGRDIGTVVVPEAELKVYLIASSEKRAHRRYQELLQQNQVVDFPLILADLERRDEIDSQRAISPLQPSPEAKIIDTEKLTPEEVVAAILELKKKN